MVVVQCWLVVAHRHGKLRQRWPERQDRIRTSATSQGRSEVQPMNETRRSKPEIRKKAETRTPNSGPDSDSPVASAVQVRISDFGLLSGLGLRISDLGSNQPTLEPPCPSRLLARLDSRTV